MKWIPILEEHKSYHFRCSKCDKEVRDTEEAINYKYCPYCGEALDPKGKAQFRSPRPNFKIGHKYRGEVLIDLTGTGSWRHDEHIFTCTSMEPLILETEREDAVGKKYIDKFAYAKELENPGILTDCFDLVFTKDLEEIKDD